MGLRIQNNIAAMNAHRNLQISDAGLSKSLERLSSGYRINKAADDAAGLAISQSFRADIASYKVASRNTSEATSLLQVAEGSLDQIGNMLTRLKELATQASSANAGSNLDKIDAEAQTLIEEIDRIATSTEYADTKLINGTFGVTMSTAGSDTAFTTNAAASGFGGVSGLKAGETYTIATAAGTTDWDITITDSSGNSQMLNEVEAPGAGITKDVYFSSFGLTLSITDAIGATMDGDIVANATGSSIFQVGAEKATDNTISISLGNATKATLGTIGGGANAIQDIDLSTASTAQDALQIVDDAIADVASLRGDIGAAQNRLANTASNLAITVENVQAAESVIRDVDMAAEMTTFTKNQILLQAGTAMLAQANMAPQQLLALFG
jgi:flagellin